MKSYLKALFLIIILLFLVTFGIRNNQLIQLNYYFDFRTADFPLYLLVYGCATIGIFIGMLIGITSRLHQRKKIKMLTKLNAELKTTSDKEKKDDVKPEDQKSVVDVKAEKISEDTPAKDKKSKSEDKDSEKENEDTQVISPAGPGLKV